MNKKILVLSISAWNSTTGMDTWPTLMGDFPPENIANICLRGETPDSKAANHYFFISENKVIKSIFKPSLKTGAKMDANFKTTVFKNDATIQKMHYQKMRKHRTFLKLMTREILWKLGKWKSKELYDFVMDFSPDVILYSMDGYIHFNRLCRYVKKISNAKSIGYFVDDNFTYKQSKRINDLMFRFFQKRSLKKLAQQTNDFWAISDMTKKEADEVFNIDCTVITKPIKNIPAANNDKIAQPIHILYTGNLLIGRDKSLLKLINTLKQHPDLSKNYMIDVYTNTILDKKTENAINCEFCKIHPPIPQSEIIKLQKEADILLFLEDVDGPDAKTARLSFSTKIIDYLSAGKGIFAIGCTETAPMQYFIDNQIAIVATSEEEIKNHLTQISLNTDILSYYAKKAREIGIQNHNKDDIFNKVSSSISQVLKK